MRSRLPALAVWTLACGPQVPQDGRDETGGADDLITTTPDDEHGDEAPRFDLAAPADGGAPPQGCGGATSNPCPLDILVVVDNSAGMADAQRWLTQALVDAVGALQFDDGLVPVDVQIMFTTTDVGNPLCTAFQPPGYAPAMGAPTATGCNARAADFTGLDGETRLDACTSACPIDVVPEDPFVAFDRAGADNVPDVADADIDGDGDLDAAAAQAVACLAPHGVVGCGYESPLAAMLRALDPGAPWNAGDRPFLRPTSDVLVIVATDEADCSLDDASVMDDAAYWEVNPVTGDAMPSSAICWNAGVACEGPDVGGVYQNCTTEGGALEPVSRYTDRLVDELRELEGRDVLMIAVTGVPEVTEHGSEPPFEPIAGGIHDLVVRLWRDEDVLPGETRQGTSTADLAFAYGIGPGCTNVDAAVRGIPNPRVHDVCRALDVEGEFGTGTRCCVESICDADLRLFCLDGWLVDLVQLPPWE